MSFFRTALIAVMLGAPQALAAEVKFDGEPQSVPSGGQVVNDTDLVWKVTVPETWIWRSGRSLGGSSVLLAYTAGQKDDAVLEIAPEIAGAVVCRSQFAVERDTAKATQDDLNARAAAEVAAAAEAIAALPDGPAKSASFADTWTGGGVTVAGMVQPDPAADGRLVASAALRRPGESHAVQCRAVTEGVPAAALAAFIRSFRPL